VAGAAPPPRLCLMTSSSEVRDLADAYRNAMLAGDRELGDSLLERKFLQAMVASSAADTARWVKTRVRDGDAVVGPLEHLVPALREGDWVGQGLDAAKKQVADQVRALATTALIGATWPVWLGTVVALFVGLFGFAFDAGAAVGQALVPLVLGGGTFVYAIIRGASIAGPKAIEAAGGAAGSLWSWVSDLGGRAERLFQLAVGPTLQSVYVEAPRASGPTVIQQVRGFAKTVVWVSYALLIGAGLVFASGMYSAIETATSTPANCGLLPTDPSCD
jgi:hypothetical protein